MVPHRKWSGFVLLARVSDSEAAVDHRATSYVYLLKRAICEMHIYTGSLLICSQSGSVPSSIVIHAYGKPTFDQAITSYGKAQICKADKSVYSCCTKGLIVGLKLQTAPSCIGGSSYLLQVLCIHPLASLQ